MRFSRVVSLGFVYLSRIVKPNYRNKNKVLWKKKLRFAVEIRFPTAALTQFCGIDIFFFLLQSADIVMDLTELFQCNLMEEFGNIMNHSVRSMSVESTSEWWAKRNRLDSKMKVKWKSNRHLLCSAKLDFNVVMP